MQNLCAVYCTFTAHNILNTQQGGYYLKDRLKKFSKYAYGIKHKYDSCHIAAYSAEAAFFTLLSGVPLAMFAIVLMGVLAPLDIINLRQKLTQYFSENLSGQLAEFTAEIHSHSTIPLASVTMFFLVWTATRGIRSIADGINVIYGCKERYNIFQLGVRSVLFAVAIFLLLGAAFALAVFAQPVENLVRSILGNKGKFVLLLFNLPNITLFFAFTLLFATAYNTLAKSGRPFKNQLFGAVFASVGWIVYSFGYSVYIRCFSSYSALYGSIGAVMLFLLWLYMCMNILLCGALANRIKWDREKTKKDCKY